MKIRDRIVDEITRERQQRELSAGVDPLTLLRDGNGPRALENLMFFTKPGEFQSRLDALLPALKCDEKLDADDVLQARCLRFTADLYISLCSHLPVWNLRDEARHGADALSIEQVLGFAEDVRGATCDLAGRFPAAAERLLGEWRDYHVARLTAEEAPEPVAAARALVGDTVEEYLGNLRAELEESNLGRIAELREAGETLTEISNDYAVFLEYALYLGASFATTNPPLVDMAWQADQARWDPVVDGIIAQNAEADIDTLGRLATLEIVLANMRLLRPIFLLTEGKMGCVCLQVDPCKHGDPNTMLSDAQFFYDALKRRLEGGVPNVVFKLPGTRAGLEACRALTKKGIGVTITVNFGVFQHVRFAEAMQEGEAVFSCLVEMSGRLAYPVRDELLAKSDVLAAQGIDESQAREAAAWAGVAVTKRVYRLLRDRGYDLRTYKPLVASLRIYSGKGYEALPCSILDITEVLGTTILSVFPNIRRPFDQLGEIALQPMSIESPVPARVMNVLAHSEIFRQAYYVGDPAWMSEEDERFKPDYALRLSDEAAVFDWPPIHATLTQFMGSYEGFTQRILERKTEVR